jgi:hypothetical protein
MPREPLSSRERRIRRLLLLALGGSIVAGGVLGAAAVVGTKLPVPIVAAALGAIGLLAAAAALWATMLWWRSVDEAVRDVHKTSWFWGSCAGLLAILGLVVALHTVGPEEDLSSAAMIPGDAGLILTGLMLVMFAQLVGYGIAWAALWLWRSR